MKTNVGRRFLPYRQAFPENQQTPQNLEYEHRESQL